MIKWVMLFTGVENLKEVSVDYNPLKKSWKLTSKKGKKIFLIPSDRVLIKREKLPEGLKKRDLKRYLQTKYGEFMFDFTLEGDTYTLVLVRDFKPPEDYHALDPEPFALARLSHPAGEENLTVLDIGRRKTTYVRVENHRLKAYRVVLRGGDYLTQRLAERLNIPFERAEELKREKGLELEPVKEALADILKDLPPVEGKLLLSGGGSKLKGLEGFLGLETLTFDFLEREKFPAFGGALKFVYRDDSPTFKPPEVGRRELRLTAFALAVLLLGYLVGVQTLDRAEKRFLSEIEKREKLLFSEKFPDLPPVAVLEQLKTMRGKGKKSVIPLFEKLTSTLPKGVKIYSLEYRNGVLKVKGEAPKGVAEKLNALSLKREGDNYLFEVEIR